MMELVISEEAKDYIEKKVPSYQKVLLDFEDGDSPFKINASSCGLDVGFRLVLLQDADESKLDFSNYQSTVNTSMGEVYLKESSKLYLDDNTRLVFDPKYMRLQLKGDNSGTIANSVEIYEA
ncbi:iron-sulfur cluster biosynthesis family protein [Enterococcus devriesei]|uniref:iron-sulfur cluster biosynthesis family protein n=1 Tax=Enterococcus devriesei TaxID=319970 RepID=UPI001C0F9D8D|nr:iron-sulfur cluster biosynthesis family protein [Enterococcus devriesei]MBU5365794.1 iron-sulfur cluster biosynthesis family protein [Enterococcus devriesei]MDT2821944.1 iron-sulfur cluster biosynthesis family protein [Enterococcus devriesei]